MITAKQKQTLDFIKQYYGHEKMAPTTAEIAEGIGIESRGVVHRYLKALEAAGHIRLVPGRRRNITLIDNAHNDKRIPLLGKIAAGLPIEAIPEQEHIDVADMFLGPGRYALRVYGESMIDDGILDGDVVICQQAETARSGQIVVALIDHENATLKRIHFEQDGFITLYPANTSHQPQVYADHRVTIQGTFLGLLRLA